LGEVIIYDAEINKDGQPVELPPRRTEPYTYSRFKIGDGITTVVDLPFSLNAELDGRLRGYTVNDINVAISPGGTVALYGNGELYSEVYAGDGRILLGAGRYDEEYNTHEDMVELHNGKFTFNDKEIATKDYVDESIT
jgi:hypothetical protein